MRGETVIEASELSKAFETASGEEVQAIENVSLKVRRGEFVSVVGPSGCGKSTLLGIVSGLIPPSAGTVSVLGEQVKGPLRSVGRVFQTPLLMEWRNVVKNVLLPVELMAGKGEVTEERAVELLRALKLGGFEKMYPWELSQGMQQRVSIARALVYDPPIILMDEPFASLDELTREAMEAELLQSEELSAKTVVFVTHSVSEAVFLGDRVVVLTPRPSKVALDMEVPIPRPRKASLRTEVGYNRLCQDVRSALSASTKG